MKKEFKQCKMYHPSGIVRFAGNEDAYNAYKKRGYFDNPELKEEEKPKSKENGKSKKKAETKIETEDKN